MGCLVCGEEDCVQHRGVLTFARIADFVVLVGLTAFIGLSVWAVAWAL